MGEGAGNNEDRAGNLVSTASNFIKERNAVRWADKLKSDEFVKGELKLNGLSGYALTEHTNYKFFEKFVELKKLNRLKACEKTEASTFAVWRELGFGNINTWDDLINAADTDAFKLYQRYADASDSRAIRNMVMDNKPVPVLSSDTSWTERFARLVSWKVNGRAEEYAMISLGFDRFPPATLEANNNGRTFLLFWLLKNENSLGASEQSAKDILKKLMEFDRLSPTDMNILKNEDSLREAHHRTKILFKSLLKHPNLSQADIENSEKYRYLYSLIKTRSSDEYMSTLVNRLTPRF
ncbi:RxLR effector protein [Phytophthora megakarya]|uniref:RxLR effector protein n=1 Tax=Phytophthora megakarya TaxID=4795 RepID=A0A225VJ68_9STRA|nr:RxLR effector protein [Phytophthora megakarya]